MKSLDTIIKLLDHKTNEIKSRIAQHEKNKSELLDLQKKMHYELQNERETVAANPDFAITFAAYERMINERQETIKIALRDTEKQLNLLKNEMLNLFGEIKKYEILKAKKLKEKLQKEAALEAKTLDEIALRISINNTNS